MSTLLKATLAIKVLNFRIKLNRGANYVVEGLLATVSRVVTANLQKADDIMDRKNDAYVLALEGLRNEAVARKGALNKAIKQVDKDLADAEIKLFFL